MEFSAKNIFTTDKPGVSLIEFNLDLDNGLHLEGVDICTWNAEGKLTDLRAYLNLPK